MSRDRSKPPRRARSEKSAFKDKLEGIRKDLGCDEYGAALIYGRACSRLSRIELQRRDRTDDRLLFLVEVIGVRHRMIALAIGLPMDSRGQCSQIRGALDRARTRRLQKKAAEAMTIEVRA